MRNLLHCGQILAIALMTATGADAIYIVTFASVSAQPDKASDTADVFLSTGVTVGEAGPAWYFQPITWFNDWGLDECFIFYDQNDSFCCISGGNSATLTKSVHNQPCPVGAQIQTFGSIGGYGSLPFLFDQDVSSCIRPCFAREIGCQ
jgi:hypothetical protein